MEVEGGHDDLRARLVSTATLALGRGACVRAPHREPPTHAQRILN